MLPYQTKWADDTARAKIGLWSRQVGKDFSCGEEAVRDCMLKERDGVKTDWMIASPSERQSLESFDKAKDWARAYSLSVAALDIEREGGSEALLKSAQITFPGGSRIMAVPGKPDTVRGFSANLVLTEFAFFEDPDRTWRAIVPSITNPLRGGEKRIRIISTANGLGNKFHELWAQDDTGKSIQWSRHKITILDAVAQGMPINAQELRDLLNDEEAWAQEYMCEFIDVASVLLPYELIIPCENVLASEAIGPEYWSATANAEPVYLGIDFGRKRDLTVCWAISGINGFKLTREVLCLSKMPTHEQVEILRPRIARASRVCVDYTGPGIGFGDALVKDFGEYAPERDLFGKIELCTFTPTLKMDIFPKLKQALESKSIGLPVSRVIREDLHSVYRKITPQGGMSYLAPHNDDGHADRCTALALCNRAGSMGGFPAFMPTAVNRGRALGDERNVRSLARRDRSVFA
jgi:phage FluMu gp28-like protein